MFTSKTGHTDVVQLLLSSGAQVDLKHIVSHKNHLIAMSLRTPAPHLCFQKCMELEEIHCIAGYFLCGNFHENSKSLGLILMVLILVSSCKLQ